MIKPECPTCKGTESPNSVELYDGDDKYRCYECFTDFVPVKMGRPPIGLTKKQSLTLQEETWKWLDECVKNGHAGTRSEFLRDIIEFARTGKKI